MEKTTYIWGRNAVIEALSKRPELVEKIFIERGRNISEVETKSRENKIDIEFYAGSIPKEVEKENHQGVFAKINFDDLVVDFDYFIENLEIDNNTCLVLLSEISDPQNVGAIIRSATGFGIAGILIGEHNQAQVNGTVIKVSAGTAFSTPLVKIGNINNTLEKLKKKGFWTYGLDLFGQKSIWDEKYTEPTVFIVGSEGDGMREKTKEHCDILLNIPISEKCESLNASVSLAVTVSEWRRQKLSQ